MAEFKRILYCEGNVDGTIGGSFYSLLYLVERLDRARYKPIVVFHRDNALVPTYRAAGIDTRVLPLRMPVRFDTRLPVVAVVYKVAQRLVNLVRCFVLEAVDCAHLLRHERIDLVHLNNSITRNHHWMLGAMLARVPCVTHERGINTTYSATARFFGNRLKAILCISHAVRDALLRGRIYAERLVIVPNGLDPARVQPQVSAIAMRKRHGIAADNPVIGIVGNIKEWKGQEVVVRAVARLSEHWPTLHCLLVGDTAEDDRYYEERLRRLVGELRVDDNIIFTGYRKEVADYMNAMDVVIHASIHPEPFGRVLIEAMSIGKPVVASSDGAVTEIVVHGETGFTFSPGDDAALADAIATLLQDPALMREMGKKATQRVEEEFNISQNVNKTEALYHAIFSGSSVAERFACRTQ